MKILLVDDDEITLNMMHLIIEEEGYETRMAENGVQALTVFNEFNPDLIFTDIEMPGMNGLELLVAVREQHPETIVIVATAHGSEEYALQALRAGANNYLRKPVDLEELREILKKYDLAIEHRLSTQKIVQFVVQNDLTMQLDNRLELIFPIVDYLLLHTAQMLSEDEISRCRFGLIELLTNAIEHGNLGITFDEKTGALESPNGFDRLINDRLTDPALGQRKVTVKFHLEQAFLEWAIADEGGGFDWQSLPQEIEGSSLFAFHGRGIILSRFQFDELEYLGNGNTVRIRKLLRDVANPSSVAKVL